MSISAENKELFRSLYLKALRGDNDAKESLVLFHKLYFPEHKFNGNEKDSLIFYGMLLNLTPYKLGN